ncbi:O-acyltransferase WSD1-like [Neltuma alba]|uniref:O-acyltransferase WSD1-like n=1 Tax=Neltuma alba TaxID=207710 RepID=UPI0010A39C3F|nr:O-acyltransferase WSD1-like [Prosopis alba]
MASSCHQEPNKFKFHHSFGDGYTLMGFLLSTLRRADDPSLPLTFPSLKSSKTTLVHQSSLQKLPSFVSSVFYTVTEFASSLLRATLVKDDITPIRSRNNIGIECRQAAIFNITFTLEHIKEIKSKLGVTVNDVITGIIFYGIRLYMQDIDYESRTKDSTIMTNLSTRDAESYKTTHDMHKSRGKGSLGIQVMFSYLPIPKLKDTLISNPLRSVWEAHRQMNQKKRSLLAAVLLNKLQQIGAKALRQWLNSSIGQTEIQA